MKIKGQAFWANLLSPVDNYDKDGKEYTLDLALDPEAIQQLNEAGLGDKVRPAVNPNNGKEHVSKKPYIKFSVPTETKSGKAIPAPKIYKTNGEFWPSDIYIGNGSSLQVIFRPREWEMRGRKGVKMDLKQVMVTELVEVEPDETFSFVSDTSEEAWS